MTHLFSTLALLLHRLVDGPSSARADLSGIHVDPIRGLAMASDGKRLVEVSLPKVEGFKAGGYELANGDAEAFLMPKEAAQAILKALPKNSKSEAHRHAALVRSKEKGKFMAVAGEPGHLTPISFVPIDGTFPNTDGIWPTEAPIASVVINPELLASSLRAMTLQEGKDVTPVTLHLFKNQVVLQAEGSDKSKVRGILMGLQAPAMPYQGGATASKSQVKMPTAPKSEAAAKPPPERTEARPAKPVAEKSEVEETKVMARPANRKEPRERAGFRRPSNHGAWKPNRRTADNGDQGSSSGGPSLAQRAFYCFLVRAHGNELAVEHLETADVAARIDDLKAEKTPHVTFATWPQWRKLFSLLMEAKTDPQAACDVMNSLRDIQHTSSVIQEWLSPDCAEAA